MKIINDINQIDFNKLKLGDKFIRLRPNRITNYNYDKREEVDFLILKEIYKEHIYNFEVIRIDIYSCFKYDDKVSISHDIAENSEIYAYLNNSVIKLNNIHEVFSNVDINHKNMVAIRKENNDIFETIAEHYAIDIDQKSYYKKFEDVSKLKITRVLNIKIDDNTDLIIKLFSCFPGTFKRLSWKRSINFYLMSKTSNGFSCCFLDMPIDFLKDEILKLIVDDNSRDFLLNIFPLYYNPVERYLKNPKFLNNVIKEFTFEEMSTSMNNKIKEYVINEFSPLYKTNNCEIYLINKFPQKFKEKILNPTPEEELKLAKEKANAIFDFLTSRSKIDPYTGESSFGYETVYAEENYIIITSGHYFHYFKKYDDIFIEVRESEKEIKELLERYTICKKLMS